MDSWFSWMLGTVVVLWLTRWFLRQIGIGFSGLRTAPEDPKSPPPLGIKQLSDAVYLLHEPEGTPEIDIVFIHGLQLSEYKDAYWKTWTVPVDGTGEEICWPQTWLSEEFPNARISSVSYDSSALRTESRGRGDVYVVGESLVAEMVEFGQIGQQRPVLFVCHSLGGLVIKEVVIQAYRQHHDEEKYKNFLNNIRGFFFYATPHAGSKLADLAIALPLPSEKGPMLKHLEALGDTNSRLDSEFKTITDLPEFPNKWKFSVVAEKNATKVRHIKPRRIEVAPMFTTFVHAWKITFIDLIPLYAVVGVVIHFCVRCDADGQLLCAGGFRGFSNLWWPPSLFR
ncbi:hypothetical protein KC19_1G240000 [Ceratodon purpureus]|uniref:DUF676 domain-containing protein n=1 Tax=Ceratodon purpureus TaxID=3225 RepID=A0A8T0J8P5_CERPU|nr:hypothetical protein KC19_1G240000 [Ceratodon purpureus]